jgi:hypothetical protein
MNGLNFQASVSNLTQMDRHQHDAHRAPVENQEQNARQARDEAARRLVMTVRRGPTASGSTPDSEGTKKLPIKKTGKKAAAALRGGGEATGGCWI